MNHPAKPADHSLREIIDLGLYNIMFKCGRLQSISYLPLPSNKCNASRHTLLSVIATNSKLCEDQS